MSAPSQTKLLLSACCVATRHSVLLGPMLGVPRAVDNLDGNVTASIARAMVPPPGFTGLDTRVPSYLVGKLS